MKRFFIVTISILFAVQVAHSQSNGDYQSKQDGNWNDVNTWEVFNSGWQDLSNVSAGIYQNIIPTSSSGVISVLAHHVSIPGGFSVAIDQTSIALNGRVTVTSSAIFTVVNTPNALVINGTLAGNSSSTINSSSAGSIIFNAGSEYLHNFTTTEGILPLATWHPSSTLTVRAYTTFTTATAAGRWNQTFGNVIWNCGNQTSTVNLGGLLRTITGNFEIRDTNTGILQLSTAQRPTINISGNLEIEGNSTVVFSTGGAAPGTIVNVGGNFNLSPTIGSSTYLTNNGVIAINITGDFNMDAPGASFYLANSTTNSGAGSLNIKGHFSLQSGTILEGVSDAASSSGRINFVTSNGGKLHTFLNSGTIENRILYTLQSANDTLHIQGESQLIGNTGSAYTQSGGVLIVESTSEGGAIQTGAGTGDGNIRTATRTYSTGSRIIYQGAAAQVIGNGQTSTTSVVINNPSGVTLNNPALVTVSLANLTIEQGNLLVENNSLSVNTATSVVQLNGGDIIVNSNVAARGFTARNLILSGGDVVLTGGSFAITLTVNGELSLLDGDITMTNSSAISTFNTFGNIDLAGGNIVLNSGSANTTTTVRGDITGSEYFVFSGTNNNFSLLGSGALSRDFPISTATALEMFTLNRPGATITFPFALTLASNFLIRAGSVIMQNNLYVGGDLNIARNYSLSFHDRTLELRSQYNNSLFGGVLSANENSTLLLTGSGALDTLFFHPTGNTLGKLILDRPTTGTLVRLTTPLTIVDSLVLDDGVFANSSGLALQEGAILLRNSAASFTGVAPTGVGYDVVYEGTTLTTGIELNGNLVNVTSDCSGTVTLAGALNASGTLEIHSGLLTSGINAISVDQLINDGTLNAPSTTLTLTGDFTNNGTFNRNNGTVNFNGTSTIIGSALPIFQNITILTNGTLDAPNLLELRGHFTNNGAFTSTSSDVVRFSGTIRQNVGGLNPVTLPSVQITNVVSPYSVSIEGTVNLSGLLTLGASAKLLTNGISATGTFTLLSIDDQPVSIGGSIAAIPTTANVIGPLTVQRYMAGKTKKVNRYISSPVTGATISDIASDYSPQEIKWYNETVLGPELNGYTVAAGGDVMVSGRGYLALPAGSGAANVLWDVTGPINNGFNRGNINFNLTHTVSTPVQINADGWNLVGNPYPSNIDWGINAGWTRQNIGATITVRDLGGPSPFYKTYTYNAADGTGTLPNGVIALGQAFWVYANPDPTPGAPSSGDEARLIVNENAKASQDGTFYRDRAPLSKQLIITVTTPSGAQDDTYLKMNTQASEEFDVDLDVFQFRNEFININLLDKYDRPMLMHTLASLSDDFSIPLEVEVTEAGEHHISFAKQSEFLGSSELYLIDDYEQVAIPVNSDNSTYSFFAKQPSKISGRFRLSRKADFGEPLGEMDIKLYPNPVAGQLKVEVLDQGEAVIHIMDMKGITVVEQKISNQGFIPTSNLPKGVYLVKAISKGKLVIRKIIKE